MTGVYRFKVIYCANCGNPSGGGRYCEVCKKLLNPEKG